MTVQALGPFAGRYTVDVAALGTDGLFLLEGPTGAGKSTLIDAVVFGLYGKVASDATSDDRLRSAFAAASDETFVDLVFEVGAGVFRVRRTPAYVRPKQRGPGTTTAQATARLWRLPADWATACAETAAAEAVSTGVDTETAVGAADPLAVLDRVGEPLATRIDEVGHRIVGLVGLDRAQFVQTVVLPQGEFARFLRARPEDRRVLLQRIFGTQVYEHLADRLAELRRAGDRSVASARATLLEATARLVGAARLGSAGPGDPAPDDEVPPQEATDLVVAVAELAPTGLRDASTLVDGMEQLVGPVVVARADDATTTRARADEAHAAADRAATELAEQERLATRLAERDRLREQAARLAAEADAQAGRVAQLAAARSAREVAPLLVRLDTAQAHVSSATAAALAAHDAAPETVLTEVGWAAGEPGRAVAHGTSTKVRTSNESPHLEDAPVAQVLAERDVPVAALERAVERLVVTHTTAVGQVAALDAAVRVEAGLHDAQVAVAALTREVVDARTALAQADEQAAARPAARAALVEQVAQARTTAAGTPAAQHTLAQAQTLVAALADLAGVRTERTVAQTALAAAQDAARQAVVDEAALRQARIAGLAGELAAGLAADAPCPVCGAVEHPAPAVLAHDHVDAARVDQAEAARRTLERQATDRAQAVARLDGRLVTLTTQVGDQTPQTAADALTRAQTALVECRAATGRLTEGEAALVAFDAEASDAEDQRQALADRRTDLASALEVAADRLARDETTVTQARGDHPTVAARQETASVTAAAAVTLADALRDLAAAWVQADRSDAELADTLAARDIPSADGARAALLTAADLAALERAVVDHDTARTQVATALAALADLPQDVTADVQTVRTQTARTHAARTRAAAEAAEGRAAVAAQVHQDVTLASDQALVAARVVADVVDANAPVVRMAGLVSGQGADNARSLSLATYVLQRRFADVTAAANDRLDAMSDGRYALVPSDTKEDVTARTTGLAMRVVDHWTGTQRDPRTLSGGEAFYVSLCLALGLADVVGAEAGGIALGTLFVDEGFGSLDAQVLDQVLGELTRLRAGGRTVGIVSHVEALKQAVPDRIEVRITPEGPSTLRVVV